jgi:hypothetical protein
MRQEGIMTPSEIEPATYHLAAQCLNQLRHHIPQLCVGEGQLTLREACSSVIWSSHVDCLRSEDGPSRYEPSNSLNQR